MGGFWTLRGGARGAAAGEYLEEVGVERWQAPCWRKRVQARLGHLATIKILNFDRLRAPNLFYKSSQKYRNLFVEIT